MKFRIGFVSNSSSSSFTLCVPKGSTEEEIRTIIGEKIGKMEGFFLPNFRQDLIDTIMECKGSKADVKYELKKNQEYLETSKWGKQEHVDYWQELVDKNVDVYRGGFPDDGEGCQLFLCYTNFKIEEEDFFMENSGGY